MSEMCIIYYYHYYKVEEGFKFRDVTEEETFKKIISLDPSKACMKDDIPTKVLLGTGDIVASSLTTVFNDAKNDGKYPGTLKTADVTPLPKTREKMIRRNTGQ